MGIRQPTSEDPAGSAGEEPGGAGLRGRSRVKDALAAVLGIVLLAALVSRLQYFVDDAFITFRYARNWAEWGSPVFNSFELLDGAEKVEGYSNFAWMALLALAHRCGLALETFTPFLQLIIGGATVALVAVRGSRVASLSPSAPWTLALLLGTCAPFVAWTTGGMETGLLALLATSWFLGVLRVMGPGPKARNGWSLGLIGAALVLVRIEGLAWALGLLGAVVAAEILMGPSGGRGVWERRRTLTQALLVVAGIFGAHIFMRQLTYDAWLPNTVAAKTGGAGADVWARGSRQLASWALVSVTPVAALLALPFALRHRSSRARTVALAALFAVLGFCGYNVATGGDWMPFFRFLAPASPILALLVAIGLDAMGSRAALGLSVALAAVQPLALFDVHLPPESIRSSLRFRAFRGGYRTERASIDTAVKNAQYFGSLGKALALYTQPSDVLAFGAIGSPGWYAKDLDFVDRNGLVTPSVSRRDVELGSGTAGHEKRVPHAWFLDHGTTRPKLLYAKVVDADIGRLTGPVLRQVESLLRQDPVVGKPDESALFDRTILRTFPFTPESAAPSGPRASTLLLLERASPEEAAKFWGR